MLYLLGSKGVWYLYSVAQLYKYVAKKSTTHLLVFFKPAFKRLSKFPFQISLYLFIIEATVLPALIYMVTFYNIKIGLGVMLLGAFGLFLAIFCVFHLFLLMNRSIHILFIKSKEERLNDIISQLEECENEIKVIKESQVIVNKNDNLSKLLCYHAYLDRVRREIMELPEKPSNFLKAFELLVSILPASLLVQFLNPVIAQIVILAPK